MSDVFDLDTQGAAEVEQKARDNPIGIDAIEAGFFDRVPAAIGMGIERGAGAVARTVQMAGAGALTIGNAVTGDDSDYLTHYFRQMDKQNDRTTDYFTPQANTVGTAGRVLGGLAEMAVPLIAGGGQPSMLGLSMFEAGQRRLIREGVDPLTAAGAGLIEGGAAVVGFKIPFLGRNLGERIAVGIGSNVALGAGATQAERSLLEARGFDKQAQQYNPGDIEARTVDVLMGAVFGGIAHVGMRGRDAVLTANNAKHAEVDAAPGTPRDILSTSAHADALDLAIDATIRGEPVQVPERIFDAEFQPHPVEQVELPPELAALDREIPTAPDLEAIRAAEVRQGIIANALDVAQRMVPTKKTGAVDLRTDDLRTALEKRGGLSRDVAVSEGLDSVDAKKLRRMFPIDGKYKSIDHLLESLKEDGFLPDEAVANDALNMLQRAAAGESVLSIHQDAAAIGSRILRDAGTPKEVQTALRNALAGEKLGPKQEALIQTLLEDHARQVDEYTAQVELDPMRAWDELTAEDQGQIINDWEAFLNEPGFTDQAPNPDGSTKGQGDRPLEVDAAQQVIDAGGDIQVPTGETDASGNVVTRSAREMLDEARAAIMQAEADAQAFPAAVSCFLTEGFDAS